MKIEEDLKLDFGDVLIKPKRSVLKSRSQVNITRTFKTLHSNKQITGVPIIAANMDSVGTFMMSEQLAEYKMFTAIHKHYNELELISYFSDKRPYSFYSMGITDSDYEKFRNVISKADVEMVCIDVANGYQESFVDFVKRIRDENPSIVIMAGNVVTGEMTEALTLAGADIIKVGIGPGSVCTTRRVTGVGMPQLSAIIECADAAHGLKSQICGDGGLTVPGDFGKAFGGGADFVMVGGMFAGHYECGGEITNLKKVMKEVVKKEWIESYTGNHGREDSYWLWTNTVTGKTYAPGYDIKSDDDLPDELCDFVPTEKSTMKFYGMSSKEAMDKHSGGMAKYRAAEGKSVEIPYRGFVSDTVQDILGGLRSTMTYIGAENLKEVSKRTTFVRVNKQINDVFK